MPNPWIILTYMMINNNNTEAAQHFVMLITQGDFATVEQHLASNIKSFLVDGKLQAIWQTLEQQVGPFKQQLKASTLQTPQGQMEIVTCAFEKANLDVNIMFNAAGEIISLTMTPEGALEQQIHATNEPPPGIDTDQFSEQEIQIGQGAWILPGTLTIPVGEGPFRAVVLVHGSGPADRDETIPPNKPFRDIAWGLASRGITVLRYDKRTKVHRAQMMERLATLTVKEEVIDDALAAIALLRSRSEIDPQQIFLLGHSLGGYLAPRMGVADPTIAGLIILAGAARPLEDVLLDQLTYILSLNQADPQQLNVIKQQVERVKDPLLSPATPANELPLGISATYWLDLRDYHLAEVVQRLKQPAFILQAESDYQVTQDDFAIWKEVFEQHQNVQFKSYPGLFHLFIPVEGGQKATPATYGVAGHVSEEVVADIAQWIRSTISA
jgi:dienelactone hydrolase